MCRIAGYVGHAVALSTLVTHPPRALRAQARQPRELPPGMIGSDGYGIAWLTDEGRIARYRNTLPIWADANLDELAPHIRSRCFVASTRTATEDMPVSLTNTPPFCVDGIMLVHNGSIEHFHERVAQPLWLQLRAESRRTIVGNTDSEYIAALIADRPERALDQRVRGALRALTELVKSTGSRAALNLIVADAEQLVAVGYAVDEGVPSLYVSQRDGALRIASEPLDEEDTSWQRVAPNTLLRATSSLVSVESI